MKAAGSLNAIPNTDPESVKWTSLCAQSAELNQPGGAELNGGSSGAEKKRTGQWCSFGKALCIVGNLV